MRFFVSEDLIWARSASPIVFLFLRSPVSSSLELEYRERFERLPSEEEEDDEDENEDEDEVVEDESELLELSDEYVLRFLCLVGTWNASLGSAAGYLCI